VGTQAAGTGLPRMRGSSVDPTLTETTVGAIRHLNASRLDPEPGSNRSRLALGTVPRERRQMVTWRGRIPLPSPAPLPPLPRSARLIPGRPGSSRHSRESIEILDRRD